MKEYSTSKLNKVIRGSKRASYDIATINQILDDTFLCHIGYAFEGHAVVIPMAYARKENKIFLHGSLKNRMFMNILKAGKASVTVTHLDGLVLARSAFHHSANYRSVTVFGSVKIVDEIEQKKEALAYMVNHMISGHWEHIRQPNEKELNATLVIELTIETASAKIRAQGAVDESKDYELPIWAGVIPIKQVAGEAISDDRLLPEVELPHTVSRYVTENG
ncbi:pyridoxamine 5'-phosphate oxidase family protein [Aquimarina pacifica]|uniref:pyridoxamine 5'-phosphate oxidase family protein n=1 Tax=Aquimarina pacifica TaxID=1296415 RepID=UPI000471AF0F|nr:pyridoxamine 5'-phosphate oxidase family protein [Aquimarina pacifica]